MASTKALFLEEALWLQVLDSLALGSLSTEFSLFPFSF